MPSMRWATSRWASSALATGTGALRGDSDGAALMSEPLLRDPASSFGTRFLLRNQGAINVVGDADPARLGERLGIFLAQEGAPYAGAVIATTERTFAFDTGKHLVEHRVEKDGFKIDCVRARLGVDIARSFAARHRIHGQGRACERKVEG